MRARGLGLEMGLGSLGLLTSPVALTNT